MQINIKKSIEATNIDQTDVTNNQSADFEPGGKRGGGATSAHKNINDNDRKQAFTETNNEKGGGEIKKKVQQGLVKNGNEEKMET